MSDKPEKTDRNDEMKAALRATVIATIRAGARDGMRPDQVQAMVDGLFALGWFPPELRGVLR